MRQNGLGGEKISRRNRSRPDLIDKRIRIASSDIPHLKELYKVIYTKISY